MASKYELWIRRNKYRGCGSALGPQRMDLGSDCAVWYGRDGYWDVDGCSFWQLDENKILEEGTNKNQRRHSFN